MRSFTRKYIIVRFQRMTTWRVVWLPQCLSTTKKSFYYHFRQQKNLPLSRTLANVWKPSSNKTKLSKIESVQFERGLLSLSLLSFWGLPPFFPFFYNGKIFIQRNRGWKKGGGGEGEEEEEEQKVKIIITAGKSRWLMFGHHDGCNSRTFSRLAHRVFLSFLFRVRRRSALCTFFFLLKVLVIMMTSLGRFLTRTFLVEVKKQKSTQRWTKKL